MKFVLAGFWDEQVPCHYRTASLEREIECVKNYCSVENVDQGDWAEAEI